MQCAFLSYNECGGNKPQMPFQGWYAPYELFLAQLQTQCPPTISVAVMYMGIRETRGVRRCPAFPVYGALRGDQKSHHLRSVLLRWQAKCGTVEGIQRLSVRLVHWRRVLVGIVVNWT